MQESQCTATTREEEMDVKTALTLSNKADNRYSGSSMRSPSPMNEQSTPPSPAATQVVSTDNGEKCKAEVDDEPGNHEMMGIIDVDNEDDDVTIVPPITGIRTTTPNPVAKPDAEQDESRSFKEEQEPQSDLEMQRQRQRQARRGPTPSSSPQVRSRKTSLVVSKTGVKRDREEYEEGQVDEDEDEEDNDHHHHVGTDKPGVLQENANGSPVHGGSIISTETQTTNLADADNSEEIVILEREQKKDDMRKRQKDKKKVSTGGGGQQQVMTAPQTEIVKAPTTLSSSSSDAATTTVKEDSNPKAPGKRSYYRDFIGPPIPITSLRPFVTAQQQSTTSLSLPSPQPRLPKKLGINHMDLLYKTEQEVMVCRICL